MTAIYSVVGGIIDNRRFTKQREYMATKKTQRVAILVIMIVLVVGTLGSFAVMILAQQERSKNAAALQKAQAKYETEQKAHQAKVDAQAAELSKQYYPVFSPYFDRVGKFDIDGVKELSTEDLLVGDGEEITGTTPFANYFVGWDANGNKFTGGNNVDFEKGALTAPFTVENGLDEASLITGWKEGIKGMRLGGVRELTIPSDKAYGEQGNDSIAPNMPLKFLVMAIPIPAEPPMSDALSKAMNDYLQAQMKANSGAGY